MATQWLVAALSIKLEHNSCPCPQRYSIISTNRNSETSCSHTNTKQQSK